MTTRRLSRWRTSRRASRRACRVGALAAAVAAALACGGVARDPDTVVYASGADLEGANPLTTVHPLSRQVQRFALFVTLVRFDSSLAVEPYLARSWRFSADRRALTMHLAPGVRWHDGAPLTSRDVRFTLLAARDPATGYVRAADLVAIDSVGAPDDSTVVLWYRGPQPALPSILSELPIVPEHLLADVPRADLRRAAFNLAPVGAGPFRFASREAGQRWVFERDDAFPIILGGPPLLRRFVVAVVDEPTTKFAGLVSGELDVAGIAPTMATLVDRDPSIRALPYASMFTVGLVFNVGAPPFDDRRVRLAVSRSIDRARIVRAALAGYGIPAAGPVSPANPLALVDASAASPDVRAADSLLDASGWTRGAGGLRARGGRPLAVSLLTVGSGDNVVEQLVQADLAARGVRVDIRQAEMGAFLAAARAPRKHFDMLLAGVSGDLTLAHLSAMYASAYAGGALDYAGYHTARLDSLFVGVGRASDERALHDAWFDVQRELAREQPAAWLYHVRGVQGVARRLRGVQMDLRGELPTLAQWTTSGATGR